MRSHTFLPVALATLAALATADVSIGTNHLAAFDKIDAFALYNTLAEDTKDNSFDGSGIKLLTLSFHETTEDYYHFYGRANKTAPVRSAMSRERSLPP